MSSIRIAIGISGGENPVLRGFRFDPNDSLLKDRHRRALFIEKFTDKEDDGIERADMSNDKYTRAVIENSKTKLAYVKDTDEYIGINKFGQYSSYKIVEIDTDRYWDFFSDNGAENINYYTVGHYHQLKLTGQAYNPNKETEDKKNEY